METISDQHVNEFGQKPQMIVEVPGVCTLIGSFAEFCNGWSLVGTSLSTISIAISKREDSMVRMFNATMNDRKRFSLTSVKFRKEDRWGNYIKGVIATFQGEEHLLSGMNITIAGSLLHGDTMSTSTALALGTSLLLNSFYKFGLDDSTLIRIAYQSNVSFNEEACRISDLVTMLCCPKGKLLLFDLSAVQFQVLPFPFGDPESEWEAVVLDSKISPLAMREELILKRQATKDAFVALKKLKPNGAIREFPESDLHARAVTLPESMRHICTYVLMESHQAKASAVLLQNADAAGFGKMMVKIQNGLRDLMEMTCPEVDWLIKRASELNGCIGAVQVSNGLAGNILLLLSKEAMAQYSKRLEDYEHIFGFHPKWRVYASGVGAKVVFP